MSFRIVGAIRDGVGFYPFHPFSMDTKKGASLYELAYGTSKYRKKKGLPGPLFDLSVLGFFVAAVISLHG
jgi:hypothetical protein